MTQKISPLATAWAAILIGGGMMTTPNMAFAAPECGATYRVQAGDSLSSIARAAYGSTSAFQIIYSANSARIGEDPEVIWPGMRLKLPCLNDGHAASVADLSAIKEVRTTASIPAPKPDMIRVVAGSNWGPFLDEDQAQGGMLTEIVNVALARAEGKPAYRIDFITDWGAHLQPLISDHRYDFSLAWFRPNCAARARLSDTSTFRCNNLDWSVPLFEQVFGYYTLQGAPVPANYADIYGQTVCRPAGYATFMLEEEGLDAPNVILARATSPQACFAGLVDGTYDVVALATDTAESVISAQGLADKVQYVEGLSQALTLHAVISKTNPNAKAYLNVLDTSLREMKLSGEWFNIVRRHLSDFRAAKIS